MDSKVTLNRCEYGAEHAIGTWRVGEVHNRSVPSPCGGMGMCSVGSVRERGAEGESRENRGDNHRSGASRFARKRVFRSSISRSCSPSVESSVIEPTGRVRFPLTKLQGPKSQTRCRGCISGIGPAAWVRDSYRQAPPDSATRSTQYRGHRLLPLSTT